MQILPVYQRPDAKVNRACDVFEVSGKFTPYQMIAITGEIRHKIQMLGQFSICSIKLSAIRIESENNSALNCLSVTFEQDALVFIKVEVVDDICFVTFDT